MAGGRVTVRTFDVTEAQMGLAHGDEPTRSPLGLRGLRLSLSFEEVFQAQLRALLRAAVHGPLRIMFPFVTGVEEVRAGARRRRRRRARRSARPRRVRARRADRHHDRGAVGGADDRSAGRRSGLRQHRHQRPDPVHAGRRSHRRSRVGDVRAAAPGDPARAAPGRARRAPARRCRCRCAARWPPIRCCCRCSPASACASSA